MAKGVLGTRLQLGWGDRGRGLWSAWPDDRRNSGIFFFFFFTFFVVYMVCTVCLSACLSVCLSVCPSVCLSLPV